MDYASYAQDLFKEGYNCAQAVLAAFGDVTGLDRESALKLTAPFGGGIAKLRQTCGAVTGMCMAVGMVYGQDDTADPDLRADIYATTRDLVEKFRKRNGSLLCSDLLGLGPDGNPLPDPRSEVYYQNRPCREIVASAVDILVDRLRADGKIA